MSELQHEGQNLEICRLCLNITVAKINIFTDDFAKMIEMLTSLKIKPNDSLPQASCLKCAREVKSAFLVRRHILQSHRALTSKIYRFSNRQNIHQTNHVVNTSVFSSVSSSGERPVQELQEAVPPSTSSNNANEDDLDLGSICEFENSNSSEVVPQNNENLLDNLTSVDSQINSENLSSDNGKSRVQQNCINLETNSMSLIRNLKLESIHLKKSNLLDSYKQKILAYKSMDRKDQLNIIKWMENKNNLNTKSLSKKSKLISPIQPKKREPLKMYCNTCQIKFANKITYKNHMSRHKLKACPICDKQIRSAYLKKHLTLHEDSPAMCEACGITCKNRVSLKMHFFYYHKSNLSVCEDCGKSFKTKTKLRYHQRKDHTKERNYKCETCGKCFFAKIYLTKHINMKHMKMRPHICEYCGKGFSGKHALRTHIRQHTNETPFQCNFCGDRFRQRVSLRGHLRNRHKVEEESKVFCSKCGKGFATNLALDVHFRLHAEIKCPWCSDTFAEKSYLEQHIFANHPNVDHTEDISELIWINL